MGAWGAPREAPLESFYQGQRTYMQKYTLLPKEGSRHAFRGGFCTEPKSRAGHSVARVTVCDPGSPASAGRLRSAGQRALARCRVPVCSPGSG